MKGTYFGLTLTPALSRPILSVQAFRPTAISTLGTDRVTEVLGVAHLFAQEWPHLNGDENNIEVVNHFLHVRHCNYTVTPNFV